MADIQLISASTNSLRCEATDLPEGATFIRWYIGLTESDMPFNGYCSVANADWPQYTFTWWGDEDEPETIQDLQPGTTYLVKISVRDADQSAIGSAVTRSFSTKSVAVRPSNWSWESTVSSGSAINMTAAEFNRFIDRVFAFRGYRGISGGDASDYYVTRGEEMLAREVNDIRSLIADMSPPTTLPSAASRDGTITAAFFNGLKNSLNSIV